MCTGGWRGRRCGSWSSSVFVVDVEVVVVDVEVVVVAFSWGVVVGESSSCVLLLSVWLT